MKRDLLNEMNGRLRLYADTFGGKNRAHESKWMDVTDMAWVISNTYNVVCVSVLCVTKFDILTFERNQRCTRSYESH